MASSSPPTSPYIVSSPAPGSSMVQEAEEGRSDQAASAASASIPAGKKKGSKHQHTSVKDRKTKEKKQKPTGPTTELQQKTASYSRLRKEAARSHLVRDTSMRNGLHRLAIKHNYSVKPRAAALLSKHLQVMEDECTRISGILLRHKGMVCLTEDAANLAVECMLEFADPELKHRAQKAIARHLKAYASSKPARPVPAAKKQEKEEKSAEEEDA